MTVLAVLLLAGCPKDKAAAAMDWTQLPRLPSPTAGTYARAPGAPEDPVVDYVLAGARPWDASLSGAAAGLALALSNGHGGLTSPEVREAAWRAGWPYPVVRAQVWPVRIGEGPPMEIASWVDVQPADAVLGLVRARGKIHDAWVALVSQPRVDLGRLPRQLPLGGTFVLPAVPAARVTIADPLGELVEADLSAPFEVTTARSGEWLIEIRDDRGPVAVFPLYVGLVPPDLGLLVPSDPPADDDEAKRLVDVRLAEVRDAYGLPPYEPDPLLDAAARATAADPTVGVDRIAPSVGLDPGDLWRWECRSSTVEGCLDAVAWDVRARPGLLAEHGLLGRAASVGSDGVRVVLVVGREER